MRRCDTHAALRACVRAAVPFLAVVAGGCERYETLVHRPIEVTVSELLAGDAPAWAAFVADLDGDGVDELVLAGHRGTPGPAYCRLDGSAPCAWQPFLARATDRHHCAAGDIDADGDLDLYCTAGADRGSGVGLNEVWRQISPLRFERVPDALGASEASSRGRLAAFFDFDHDAWPDLITTAWGQREDGADNRSKLWINREGRFAPAAVTLPPAFGARCMTIADINGDEYEDIIGCPAEAGLSVLLNRRGATLEPASIGVDGDWYWDAQFLAGAPGEASLLVSTGGVRGRMFIEITRLTAGRADPGRRRIACSQPAVDDDDQDIYCGRLLLNDADGDGHADILVSRHRGWRHEVVLGDAPDLLIYGPAFREFSDLPIAAHGAGERLLATRIGIVQVNAGEAWSGSVTRLRMTPGGQIAPVATPAP
ncbi:MAG: VCBS repeat-containing protein [Halieaceae bacterium]|jgi:hypothetical protein|nr:VCBS repeat-containing protein [Halieaceae bacterium]